MTRNRRWVQTGLGVCWMVLGLYWGFAAHVWIGIASIALGTVQVINALRSVTAGQPGERV